MRCSPPPGEDPCDRRTSIFMVIVDGYRTLITHVFDRVDEYLDNNAVFGVKESLIADFDRHEPGRAPDGRVLARP